MTIDWCPGIKDVCNHWKEASMLQQTYEALVASVNDGNDACIDCAKSIVEVVCRIIIDEHNSPTNPCRPVGDLPKFGEWVAGAIRALKLGEIQHRRFKKLVSQHHKLTTALGELRNESGPVSHGREGFLSRLTDHHRKSALLSADAIITFLHQAYLESELDLTKTREPYDNERLREKHNQIDLSISLEAQVNEDGYLEVTVILPTGDSIDLSIEPSRFLYQIDREAYVEALTAAKSTPEKREV